MAELKRGILETLERLKKDKKSLLTVVIGIAGMLLVLLSELPFFSGEERTASEDTNSYYIQDLEQRTEKMISKIAGAGKVGVMLTYECAEETVWAKDISEKTDGNTGGNVEQKHIIIDASQGETGLAVKVIYPKVRGVAVVCSGGDDPTVRSEIKALVSALFDIGSNRISIARRADEE